MKLILSLGLCLLHLSSSSNAAVLSPPDYGPRGEGEIFTMPPSTPRDEIVIYDPWLEYGFATGYSPCAPQREFEESFISSRNEFLKRPCGKELFAFSRHGIERVALTNFTATSVEVCGSDKTKVGATIQALQHPAWFITSISPADLKSAAFLKAKAESGGEEIRLLRSAYTKKFSKKPKAIEGFAIPNRKKEFVVVVEKKAYLYGSDSWTLLTAPKDYERIVPFKSFDGFFSFQGTSLPFLVFDGGTRLFIPDGERWRVFYAPFSPPGGC